MYVESKGLEFSNFKLRCVVPQIFPRLNKWGWSLKVLAIFFTPFFVGRANVNYKHLSTPTPTPTPTSRKDQFRSGIQRLLRTTLLILSLSRRLLSNCDGNLSINIRNGDGDPLVPSIRFSCVWHRLEKLWFVGRRSNSIFLALETVLSRNV